MTTPLELRELTELSHALSKLNSAPNSWELRSIFDDMVKRAINQSAMVNHCVAYRLGEIDLGELLNRAKNDEEIEVVLKFCPELTRERIQQLRVFQ